MSSGKWEENWVDMPRSSATAYYWFFDNFGKKMVGMELWKASCRCKRVSEFVKPGLEAFVLVCIENYKDEISDMVAGRASIRKPKYTAQRVEGATAKNCGWSDAGISRHKVLVNQVKRLREENREMEEEYRAKKEEEDDKKKSRKRQREEHEIRANAYDDFEDNEQGLVVAI